MTDSSTGLPPTGTPRLGLSDPGGLPSAAEPAATRIPRALASFHPVIATWFARTFGHPTEPQVRGWPAIQAGQHTLIAAPTGSGKTLAAFLVAIDGLLRKGLSGQLQATTQVLYVSPLKALSNDIQRNLELPLAAIQEGLREQGLPPVELRTVVRTGDTPAAQRTAMVRQPPHIFVTTPESLYILLTSESGRRLLATVETVIVDEIHAIAGDKRGAHLALSLERLAALVGGPLTRIGLSATQKPIEEIAHFLVGPGAVEGPPQHAAQPAAESSEGDANKPSTSSTQTNSTSISGTNTSGPCVIVDVGHRRAMDLALELPNSPLEAVMSHEVWGEIYSRLTSLIAAHRTTLIFVNTRRLAERVTRHLGEQLGEEHVASHHGSLSREQRQRAEQRLKHGQLKSLVATASLELGIDIGSVDLVCQLGSTRAISTFLQRVGRSGHWIGGLPKGRLFPMTRDELVESVALLDSVHRGELDRIMLPQKPLDILAQQIVAAVACEEWKEDELLTLVRRAYPYRQVTEEEFNALLNMLAVGFSTRRGRRGAFLHRDAVNGRLRGRRGARLAAITCGGAIPDIADYEVRLEPEDTFIGTLNEDFAIESMTGDIFQLGNHSWRVLRVEAGKVRVEDAHGLPPTIPFWLGEAPGRTAELSASVSRLREEISARLPEHIAVPTHFKPPASEDAAPNTATPENEVLRNEVQGNEVQADKVQADKALRNKVLPGEATPLQRYPGGILFEIDPSLDEPSATETARILPAAVTPPCAVTNESLPAVRHVKPAAPRLPQLAREVEQVLTEAREWVEREIGVDPEAAAQVVEYLAAGKAALGVMPTQNTLVLERFFDETGGMQLVIHSPFGSRLNRAWGLALRKRFCRKFNFELQAAATEDAIVLSLGQTHSFALEEVFRYLQAASVREVLIQALLDAPMFTTRWRWNATRSLAVLRWRGGKKVPAPLQRFQAEDLVAAVFPDQLACFENLPGKRDLPDHPLVNQTVRDCLEEAMDIDGLEELLRQIEAGALHLVGRDLSEPSPLAQEILTARPYAFLDDAPLEERRTQAVVGRRWRDPTAPVAPNGIGALDNAAVERVRSEAWPQVVDADDLHDALVVLGFLTEPEGQAGSRKGAVETAGGESEAGSPQLEWTSLFETLVAERRASRLTLPSHPTADQSQPPAPLWIAAERLPQFLAVYPKASLDPPIDAPHRSATQTWDPHEALVELVRSRLEGLGPITELVLGAPLGLLPTGLPDALPITKLRAALATLQAEGFAMRGQFTNECRESTAAGDPAEEWCDRRLLARIHRYTLNRLRQEIEPVSSAVFMRFLFTWQGLTDSPRPEGPEALAGVLEQLEGFEAPAAAWEAEILPARLEVYDPLWLDSLCLSGRVLWARLTAGQRSGTHGQPHRDRTGNLDHCSDAPDRPGTSDTLGSQSIPSASNTPSNRGARGWGPVRSTPLAFTDRTRLDLWRHWHPREVLRVETLSSSAQAVEKALRESGASFFSDLGAVSGLLPSQLEEALGELAAAGLATSDSFQGLRGLITPSAKRPSFRSTHHRLGTTGSRGQGDRGLGSRRAGRQRGLGQPRGPGEGTARGTARGMAQSAAQSAAQGMARTGRWSLLGPVLPNNIPPNSIPLPAADLSALSAGEMTLSRIEWKAAEREEQEERIEAAAWTLLRRYGVVMRRLLERERAVPPWRDLLRCLRRLEARGEVRGGRFVAGFAGEQFALPEAVGALREVRRQGRTHHSETMREPQWISLSAADPLNLIGIVTPGARLPAVTTNRVVFRDGVPVAMREGGKIRLQGDLDPQTLWVAKHRLEQRVPPLLFPGQLFQNQPIQSRQPPDQPSPQQSPRTAG